MKTALFPAALLLLASSVAVAQAPAPDTPGAQSERSGIDLLDYVEQVGNEIDQDIITDPRMRGIRIAHTPAEADLETLQAHLRLTGFATVETADQILIVPESTARSQPSRILQDDDRNVSDHEIVTRVIEVPNISSTAQDEAGGAARLVPLLRPMLSQSAQLGTMAGSNRLVIVDRYDNVRRITELVELLTEGLDD